MSFVALGYLRTDVSRQRRSWDEARMRSVARRLGYVLGGTIAFGPRVADPVQGLLDAVVRLGAEAVVVPGLDHFTGRVIPAALVGVADVITVAPECTWARWSTGELPQMDPL